MYFKTLEIGLEKLCLLICTLFLTVIRYVTLCKLHMIYTEKEEKSLNNCLKMLVEEKELSCVYILNQFTYWVSLLASIECFLQMLVYILIYYFDHVEK